MEFVESQDFITNPRKILKKLKKSKKILIISRGKLIAMLSDMEGKNIEEEIKVNAVSKGIVALSKIRQHAKEKGLTKLTMTKINKEINESRK